ncbi:argininosuccinate synthase, partial [Candidatus Bathyarchaeota archaeon]|nr:argininosuccinate synthase [Candidatus Bathyarchaeota archaeon]
MKDTVILAYSGGLDTSVLIKWLQEEYDVDVVTFTMELGQQTNLRLVGDKARSLGAKNHYSVDGTEDFVLDYVFPAIKANSLYEGKYPMATALGRPLIAKKLVEIAKKENATAVAHGCTGKGNDQVRFDVTIKALAPNLKVMAPVREWGLCREEEIKYANNKGISIPHLSDPYSIDQNLWGRSIECGHLENADQEPLEEIYTLTSSPKDAPDSPEYLRIHFEAGCPIALNGKQMKPVALIEKLNKIAGKHGIGRVDHIEDRLVGIKSREIYESPAAEVLIEAHKDLEKMILTRHELEFKKQIEEKWTWLVYNGLWIDPLREALEAFIDKTQERICGEVRMKLYKGRCWTIGRSSPMSLYDKNLATYEVETSFNQAHAEGFIELWGLPTKVASVLN